MREALALAETAIGVSDPNPRVGCVIGTADGRVLGRGATQRAGEAHAEVMALRDARAAGADVRGATVWVTLEPCAHHGRTPPCCDALIAERVGRVVVAIGDPFPQVAGEGIARLRAAGIEVELAGPSPADAARELNVGFFARVRHQRPWVRMKIAGSLDGRSALPNGISQWITGPEARADGHAWRRRAGAVLTGVGTVLADDPRLDVRLVTTERQPLRVIVDSRLRTPPTARALAPPGRALLVHALEAARAGPAQTADVEFLSLPAQGRRAVDLAALLRMLAEREVNEVHVEAGPTLCGALLELGLVDEMIVYVAPRLLGPGRDLATLRQMTAVPDQPGWSFLNVRSVGADLALTVRPNRSAADGQGIPRVDRTYIKPTA